MLQMMAFVNTGFTAAFTPLWAAFEMEAAAPAVLSVLRDFGRQLVKNRHDQLEEMIGTAPYLAGEHLTLADTTLIGVARWADFHQAVDPGAYPKLTAWRRRVESEPAVHFAEAIEDGAQPTGSGACRGHVPLADMIQRFGS